MKAIMTNKSIYSFFMALLMVFAASASQAQQSGLDTLALSKQTIPLENGDPRPLLALAAKHGAARGKISGKAAALIKDRTGSDAPIFVDATKVGSVPDQPGCSKIRLTYSTSKEYSKQFPQQPPIDIAVCPNK